MLSFQVTYLYILHFSNFILFTQLRIYLTVLTVLTVLTYCISLYRYCIAAVSK